MLLARGENKWTNLRSFFVDTNKLFIFLKQENFTGYVLLLFPESQGLILFQEGDVVNGMIEEKKQRKNGRATVRRILGLADQHADYRISVAEFPTEVVSILSEIFNMRVSMVYDRLSSEFSSLARFVSRLNSTKFNGYLDIRFPDDRRKGMEILLFRNGEITAIVSARLQFRMDSPNKQKALKIRDYLKNIQNKNVQYSVFAAA
jgi:hypothetical protein